MSSVLDVKPEPVGAPLRASANVGAAGSPVTSGAWNTADRSVDVASELVLPVSTRDLGCATDSELMLCLRAGMPEALAEAFRRHQADLVRTVRHLYPSIDAEDIVQDVFGALLRTPERFDARRGSLATFLAVQARSRCLDVGRTQANRRRREQRADHALHASSAERVALSRQAIPLMRTALSRLPADERSAIELAFLGGLSYHSVGQRLGIPEGTAKSRIRRGLQRLRDSSDVLEAMAT